MASQFVQFGALNNCIQFLLDMHIYYGTKPHIKILFAINLLRELNKSTILALIALVRI